MSSIWLPESLYRSLPAVYGIAGLALLMLFRGNAFAALSAMLLVGAALLISVWRYRHRATVSTSASARDAFYRRRCRAPNVNLTES